MAENAFVAHIRKICKAVLEDEVGPAMEKKCHELMEKQLDETVPLIVAEQIHKLLEGAELAAKKDDPAAEDPDPDAPTGGHAAVPPKKAGAKPRKVRASERGKRKRCAKCGCALTADGKHHGGKACK